MSASFHALISTVAQERVQHRVVIMRCVWRRRLEGLVPQGQSIPALGVDEAFEIIEYISIKLYTTRGD